MARKRPDAPLPWLPAPYAIADAYAIKHLVDGTATPDEQKRALRWIVETLCATYDLSMRPDEAGGDRATVFAEGKRFVGLQIVKLIKIDPDKLRTKEENAT
jgi:hypothetical protein